MFHMPMSSPMMKRILGFLPEADRVLPAWANRTFAAGSSAIASSSPFDLVSDKQTGADKSANAGAFCTIGAWFISAALVRLDSSDWREATA
jgi:hypothetical protein